MELNNHQFLKPLVLLAALKQFEYQATNRLLLAASEEYGDSGSGCNILISIHYRVRTLTSHNTEESENTPESPYVGEIKRMRKQCVPGSLFPRPPRAWVRG